MPDPILLPIKWSEFPVQNPSLDTDYSMLLDLTDELPFQNKRVLNTVLRSYMQNNGFLLLPFSSNVVIGPSNPNNNLKDIYYAIYDLQPSTSGLSVTLPNMSTTTWLADRPFRFTNLGNDPVTIKSENGTLLSTIKPTETHVYICDNTGSDSLFAVWQWYIPLGKQGIDIFGLLKPTATSGATPDQRESATNKNNVNVLSFSQTGLNYAFASFSIPQRWGNTNLGAQFIWKVNSTSTNNVVWNIQSIIRNPNDAFDKAYGTAQSVTSAGTGTANQEIFSPVTSAIVPNGTGTGNRTMEIRVYRNGGSGSDNLAADVDLIGVLFWPNFIAANDAGNP